MEQFIKLDTSVLKNKKLNSDEKIVLSLLNDRMKSSMQRNDFYDTKKGAFYVIYTIDEIMDVINVAKATAVKILKKLENLGYVTKQKTYSRATKLFLPKFKFENTTSSEIEPTQVQNLESNQKTNQNLHNNTINTDTKNKNVILLDQIKQWSKATKQKVGLTFSSIQAIQKFCKNNVEKCKHVVRLILNARNSVAKDNRLAKQPVAQFESNQNIINGLAQQLEHIFSYAVKLPQNNYAGYITNALKAYFTAAFGLETKPVTVKPSVKFSKFNDSKKRVHETLPEWAKDDYYYVPEKNIDIKKKERLKKLINEI
ncbi:replication initiator protein A [Apilactobacillus xinyiensis]|uniref:replication initiator protein A n=1 Tax=Apilactobacillus xinyiensis TaxID=2841032 RepID=UPI00201039D4|nr:replication initiator protein A [Apilactobacillus xinyiensis]MCL0319400.1 replication initiator protein A [Apilactobacillus xinyiensis]